MEIKNVAVLCANGTMGRNIASIFASLGKARNGMMLNIGGSATTNYVFVVGKE